MEYLKKRIGVNPLSLIQTVVDYLIYETDKRMTGAKEGTYRNQQGAGYLKLKEDAPTLEPLPDVIYRYENNIYENKGNKVVVKLETEYKTSNLGSNTDKFMLNDEVIFTFDHEDLAHMNSVHSAYMCEVLDTMIKNEIRRRLDMPFLDLPNRINWEKIKYLSKRNVPIFDKEGNPLIRLPEDIYELKKE